MDQQQPTDAEERAILIGWRTAHPDAPDGSVPTAEERDELLRQIRERMVRVETYALSQLHRATYNPPTYSGMNSPYMRFALPVILVILAAVGGAMSLWGSCGR